MFKLFDCMGRILWTSWPDTSWYLQKRSTEVSVIAKPFEVGTTVIRELAPVTSYLTTAAFCCLLWRSAVCLVVQNLFAYLS